MVRTNQGGSVLSFVAIGVVIVALFVGGAYVVHQQVAQPAPEVVPAQKTTPSEPEKQQPDTSEKQDKKVPQISDDNSSAAQSSNSNGASELPQTGPNEQLASLFVLGALSAAVISYVRSRHPEFSL